MSRYVVIDGGGLVVNVVNWDGSGGWAPPVGAQALQHNTAGPGWTFSGGQFFPPAEAGPSDPVPQRQVAKSIVLGRLTDEQLNSALAVMTPRQKERWRAPDVPFVYADDEEVIGLIQFIGADPAYVLA